MPTAAVVNLAPDRFVFWFPPAGATVTAGAESLPVALPAYPLPIAREAWNDGAPSEAAIGQGIYDYLRQFPDCTGNHLYAELLRDAYPYFLSDLAAHAVLLDAKQVEPSYVARKLTCLKILRLLEPRNRGLLWQLARGYFDLALEFAELARCRQHLREALRYAQEMLSLDDADASALSLLAEVDLLLGDIPVACHKWRRLAMLAADPAERDRIAGRIRFFESQPPPAQPLVAELEMIAEAMRLHAVGDDIQAAGLLDRIDEQGHLPVLLPSADFYSLLGLCRQATGDLAGAAMALQKALDLEPDHAAALETLRSL